MFPKNSPTPKISCPLINNLVDLVVSEEPLTKLLSEFDFFGSQNPGIKGGDPDSRQKGCCYQLNLKNFKEKSLRWVTPGI